MSNITHPKYKLPTNLSITSVTASAGFSGNLIGTASSADKLDNIDSISFARLDIHNSYNGNQTITGHVSASSGITGSFKGGSGQFSTINSDDLIGNGTRVVYANNDGKLIDINNSYTYDTANMLASYKIKISGSAAGATGSFFITPSDKGYFVPLNCVYMHESGNLSAGTISAGYTLTTPNDFCNNSSVSLSSAGGFQQISLRTGNNIAKAAPPNTTAKWYLSSGGGTNATGTLCITGYYSDA